MMNQVEREIWETIRAMNRCWTSGDPSELAKLSEYFHATMVAITPTDRLRIEGKQACFNGWADFSRSAKIAFWKEIDPDIRIYNDAAVVTYYFEMAFEMKGEEVQMGGRDMFVLIKEKGKWIAVADQYSPYPREQD